MSKSSNKASFDLESFSEDELKALIEQATTIIETRQETQRKEAMEEIQRLATTHGLNINIKQRGSRGRKAGKAADPRAPKYRNPEDSQQTWAGIGPRPKWFKDLLAAGMTKKALEI
ncbi:MAG: H-NS histone family protein [Gammaproteobacteria bacterium]|nr:H-NS histone family protein [Gammaproteobacteria bacterium]